MVFWKSVLKKQWLRVEAKDEREPSIIQRNSGDKMKYFNCTMKISVNPDITEQEMMQRFEEFMNVIPHDIESTIFKHDCCLVSLHVLEETHIVTE